MTCCFCHHYLWLACNRYGSVLLAFPLSMSPLYICLPSRELCPLYLLQSLQHSLTSIVFSRSGPSCSKTCLATVLIRSIFRAGKCTSTSARVQFFQRKLTNWRNSKTCFALITHLLSTQTTKSWKMLTNNKFKAQSLNPKSYRKFTLSCFSITCFKHVGLVWPISTLDRKQVRGYMIVSAPMKLPWNIRVFLVTINTLQPRQHCVSRPHFEMHLLEWKYINFD